MLELRDVWFRYSERWILRGVTCRMEKGINCIVGPNGSGKTTLLRVIIGALRPQRGEVVVCGRKIRSLKDMIGIAIYVPSNPMCFLVGPKVEDEIPIGETELASIYGIRWPMKRGILKLSEGERHILAVISAIFRKPTILVLDEPTVGLDQEHREKIMRALRLVSKQMIVVMATNDIRIVKKCDKIFVLDRGKIIAEGEPRDVLYGENFEYGGQIVSLVRSLQRVYGKSPNMPRPLNPKELSEYLRRLICLT